MSDFSRSARTVSSGLRDVVEALADLRDVRAVLAIVVATGGSTYRKPGALLLRGGGRSVGWLSGGCLEAELALIAGEVLEYNRARVHAFNTSGDDDLLFGSASGCRGSITLLLLPVCGDSPVADALRGARDSSADLELTLRDDGGGTARSGVQRWDWPASAGGSGQAWSLQLAAPSRLLLLGAGPEAEPLIRHAQGLGWFVEAVEHRGRWAEHARGADAIIAATPAVAWTTLDSTRFAVALVMGHHYANDLAHLRHLAECDIGYVGLLGPPARRDALLADLDDAARARLRPRLHAPVGLHLGGEGPQAIALAIVAELQRHLNGVSG